MSNYVIVNGELYHFGVKGMKWGIRRYRNADGTLTDKGKKRYSSLANKYDRKAEKSSSNPSRQAKYKQKASDARKEIKTSDMTKARNSKLAKQKYEDDKQTALRKGSASDILRFKGDLTNNEMQQAVNRLNLERQLSDISSRETTTGKAKAKAIIKSVGDTINTVSNTVNAIDKGINTYNRVASFNNQYNETKIPLFPKGKKNK